MAPALECSRRSTDRVEGSTAALSGNFRSPSLHPRRVHDTMNQWIGPIVVEEEFYRPQPWRRFALTGPLAVVTILAMMLGSRFIKPTLSPPREYNAIEAQLIE